MAAEGYKFAGYVNLKKVSLVGATGEVVDIGNVVDEINIYQDLQNPFMTCDIFISDSTSLFDGFTGENGFTGMEMLVLRYTTRYPKGPQRDINQAFVLYTVSERGRIKEKQEVLVVEGISLEGFFAFDKKITKSYGGEKGNRVHKMVKSIVEEYIHTKDIVSAYTDINTKLKVNIKKENIYHETISQFRYISPYLSPTTLIAELIAEADNHYGTPAFYFFEDSFGFKFADLERMINRAPVFTYTYTPSNTSSENDIDNTRIIDYNVLEQNSMMTNISEGLFASHTINIDVLQKTKKDLFYDYEKATKNQGFRKLNDRQIIPGVLRGGDAALVVNTTRKGHDQHSLLKWENHYPKKYPEQIATSQSYRRHLSNVCLQAILHGNTDLDVGRIITLIIPQATTIGETGDKSVPGPPVIDKYLSGYYLITSLRHKISGEQMQTVVEVVKDTKSAAIAAERAVGTTRGGGI